MAFDNVVYHPTVNQLVQFLDTTAGREKTLRLLQYFSRFLASKYGIILARQLQAQFTTTRKLLRFLKPLNHIQLASKFYDNKIGPDELLRWTNVVKNLFSAAYLALDQLNLLRILQILPVTPWSSKQLPRWTNWMWFGALIAGLTNDIRAIELSHRRIKSATHALKEEDTSSQQEKSAKESELIRESLEERYKATRKLIWDCFDLFIVLNNLGYVTAQDSSVGAAGVVTSLLGLQDLWRSAAK